MTNTNNGGPAFPLPPVSHNGKVVALTEGVAHGMTLRDYFAAKALQGMLSNPALMAEDGSFHASNFTAAYQMADAMLRAREAS